jgi:two-component system chemotaxis response regulator CheY
LPPTVLIVDDSPTIRGIAKIFLKPLSVDVMEAEEGTQALEMVRASLPAVAIVDVNMPGMDGLTFLRELRGDARPEIARLPVVLLTGDRSEETRRKGREAGATDFIEKPIKGAELQALVKKFLGRMP